MQKDCCGQRSDENNSKDFKSTDRKPIGRFVVDFYCPKAKLVIELDGGQHYSEAIQASGRIERQIHGEDWAQGFAILR